MSIKNYQANGLKKRPNAMSQNVFVQKSGMSIHDEIDEERKDQLKNWIGYFRAYPHRFVEMYTKITLYPFQKYWLYLMFHSEEFLGICSRASGKSWLAGLSAVVRCILYPGTIVTINSKTKKQASLVIAEKIEPLRDENPNLQREITNILSNGNEHIVSFANSSIIKVVLSGEGGRGARSNLILLDERRLLDEDVLNRIIRPFAVSRQPPYSRLPEYAHIPPEESQEIIISSAYYKSHPWHLETRHLLKKIASGDKSVRAVFFDYPIVIKHKIKTAKAIEKARQKSSEISFAMEYGNIAYSSNENAFYQVEFFKRNLKKGWLPRRKGAYGVGKNKYDIPRKDGEIRIVSVDVAAKAGAKNDNTIITCARLFPTIRGYSTHIVYLESHNGKNSVLQALRIKQIYEEFSGYHDGDALILDVLNIGLGLYDNLTQIQADDDFGLDRDAMKVMEHPIIKDSQYEDLNNRCLTEKAHPCIFPISATAKLNSEIASSFRVRLKSGLLNFLMEENQQEEWFIKKKNKDILQHEDITLRAYLLAPNVQTSLLINECISLTMTLTGGENIKLEESPNSRKDRFSSVSYLNYYVSLLDQQLLKEDYGDDLETWVNAFSIT